MDSNVGLTMYSAPFYCPRDRLFDAVFGKAAKNFKEWSASFDLGSDSIVAALDHCQASPPVAAVRTQDDTTQSQTSIVEGGAQSPSGPLPVSQPMAPAPAPEPAVDAAAVPASTNLLRATHYQTHHRHVHREIYHHKIQRSL